MLGRPPVVVGLGQHGRCHLAGMGKAEEQMKCRCDPGYRGKGGMPVRLRTLNFTSFRSQ